MKNDKITAVERAHTRALAIAKLRELGATIADGADTRHINLAITKLTGAQLDPGAEPTDLMRGLLSGRYQPKRRAVYSGTVTPPANFHTTGRPLRMDAAMRAQAARAAAAEPKLAGLRSRLPPNLVVR